MQRFALGILAFSALTTVSVLSAQTFTFNAPKAAATSNNTGAYVADVNGDGKVDAILNTGTGMSFSLGNGSGTFGAATPIKTSNLGELLQGPTEFTDVNGDGKADLVIIYAGYADGGFPGEFIIELGDGKGNFTETTNITGPTSGTDSVISGDFNKDGKIDFAVLNPYQPTTSGTYVGSMTIYLNSGGGVFKQGQYFTFPEGVIGSAGNFSALGGTLVTGDFNDDGKLDLAWGEQVTSGATTTYRIDYRDGNGDGTFGTEHNYVTDGQIFNIAAADLNKDGKADLVVALGPKLVNGKAAAGAQARVATLLSNGTTFTWSTATSQSATPYNIALLDMNGDGILDLVLPTFYSNTTPLQFRPGTGNGEFGTTQALAYVTGDNEFSPLVTGGLPAVFYETLTSNTSTLKVLVNTSMK